MSKTIYYKTNKKAFLSGDIFKELFLLCWVPAGVYDEVKRETISDETECFPEKNLQFVEVDAAQNI